MIMTTLYLLFIALINSFDNIGIRIAYSIGGIKVQLMKNILISLMAFMVSFLATLSGSFISSLVSEEVSSILSMLLLSFTGIKIILEGHSKKDREEISAKTLNYKEAIYIGTALALDDIGGSIGVGLAGYAPIAVGLSFFTVSFIIFLAGNYMIKLLRKLRVSSKLASTVAGIMMIAIAILQVLE